VFSYVDPRIRSRLERNGSLVTIDREGRPVADGGGDRARPHISLLGPIPLPRDVGGGEHLVHWYAFVRRVELNNVLEAAGEVTAGGAAKLRELLQTNMSVNSILATPGFAELPAPLVRVHSCCITGDVFGSKRCECGPQLAESFSQILAAGGGAVVYMSSHEGRGIGLWAKAITYLLQDEGQDTYEANVSLGLPEDSRDFTDAAVALRYLLGGKPLRLLSNNPLKQEQLERAGQPVSEMVRLVAGICDHNVSYVRCKRLKGHLLPEV
jgi:GTP cyclohydrolase II